MISWLYLFGLPFAILLSATNDVSAKVVTLPSSTTSTESLCKTGRSLIFGYCKLSGHDQLWSTTHPISAATAFAFAFALPTATEAGKNALLSLGPFHTAYA